MIQIVFRQLCCIVITCALRIHISTLLSVRSTLRNCALTAPCPLFLISPPPALLFPIKPVSSRLTTVCAISDSAADASPPCPRTWKNELRSLAYEDVCKCLGTWSSPCGKNRHYKCKKNALIMRTSVWRAYRCVNSRGNCNGNNNKNNRNNNSRLCVQGCP